MNGLSKDFVKSENKHEFLKNLVGIESQEGDLFIFTGLDKEQRQTLYSNTGGGVGFSKIDDTEATIEIFSTENINSVNSEGSENITNNDDSENWTPTDKLKITVDIQTSVIRHMDHQIVNLKNEIRLNTVLVFGFLALIFINS